MAEKKRDPLSLRIFNAYRVLRGDPWPMTIRFDAPPMVAERPDLITFGAVVTLHREMADQLNDEEVPAFIKRDMAMSIAEALIEENAITIIKTDGPDGWSWSGRVRAVMPKKEDDDNG